MPGNSTLCPTEQIEGCVCPCCGKLIPVKIKISGNVIDEGIVAAAGWGQEQETEPYPVIIATISLDSDGVLENIDYLKEAAEYRKGFERALREGRQDEFMLEHATFLEKSRQRTEMLKEGGEQCLLLIRYAYWKARNQF